MIGIVLAGGNGTRLYPINSYLSKQLIPIYDKPLIYYPLSILMLSGIKEILIVCKNNQKNNYHNLLGDGSKFGIKLTYVIQNEPKGLPDAFIVCEKYIKNKRVCMILGDNIFYGSDFVSKQIIKNFNSKKCTIFAKSVFEPQRYGVIVKDKKNNIVDVIEKPLSDISNLAITGLYLFDDNVSELSKKLTPSKRGELEIVDLIKNYLENDNLNLEILGRGVAWFDSGTFQAYMEASNFVKAIEERHRVKIACLEEIALNKELINIDHLKSTIQNLASSEYKDYLNNIVKNY